MKTSIKRDTNYSFIKTLIRPDGKTLSRKLEVGNVDYSNACSLFHRKNTAIEIGNEINF